MNPYQQSKGKASLKTILRKLERGKCSAHELNKIAGLIKPDLEREKADTQK